MLIFTDHSWEVNTSQFLNDIHHLLVKAEKFNEHSTATELLIKFGELESSLTDLICPEKDLIDEVIGKLRCAAILTGHIFISSLSGDYKDSAHCQPYLKELNILLHEISCAALPALIKISLPEGYAYYGLYPEMYYEAAKNFIKKRSPDEVFTIGIRSIGTSLSAVVSACLKENNCRVNSITVRPRGDYFSRQLYLDDKLNSEIHSKKNAYFLIVDEGPGLSGTSLCSVAEYLSDLGIRDDRIIFFPSWEPDAGSFVSELSKIRWPKHEKYSVSFEDAIINNGNLKASFHYSKIDDISAGNWRRLFYSDAEYSPAVYQNFEQRKYLINIESGKSYLIKFAGLGYYGLKLFSRARKLSEAGFSPKALDIKSGFIRFELIHGKPLEMNDVNSSVLERFAYYLTFIKKSFPSEPSLNPEEINEMIRINVIKGIGDEWKDKLNVLNSLLPEPFNKHSAEIDGRMLPHEWLKSEDSLIKADSIHHHSDHLLPGSIDIAWDIAGTIIEFHLKKEFVDYFLDKYIVLSNDVTIRERLDFYLIAYIAFRLGYAKFSSERLGESSDGMKFRKLSAYYSSVLKDMLQKGHSNLL